MGRDDWNRRYETSGLVWTAEANQFLVADLDGTGLEIERAERVTRSIATSDGTRQAIDALARARRPPAQ